MSGAGTETHRGGDPSGTRRDLALLAAGAALIVVATVASFSGTSPDPGDNDERSAWVIAGIDEAAARAGSRVAITPPWVAPPSGREVATNLRGIARRRALAGCAENERRAGVWWGRDCGDAERRHRAVQLEEIVSEAEVTVVSPAGEERRCDDWRFDRWFCGPDEWNYVGPATPTLRSRPFSCVWAHPIEGEELRIRWDNLGGPGLLDIRFAVVDSGITADSSPVDVEIHTGDVEPTELATRTDGRQRRHRAQVGAGALEIRVSAADTSRRHFCFAGTLIPSEPSGGLGGPGAGQ